MRLDIARRCRPVYRPSCTELSASRCNQKRPQGHHPPPVPTLRLDTKHRTETETGVHPEIRRPWGAGRWVVSPARRK
ncbi:hypothetical protein GCM10010170_017650 [Dactylosporangium salmoneum]|uniref:Uncharacterized protein n=1 Tax=Dactylosporangium salmoneum TaxID=53361 RepID=A0ABN3FT68_9ACTN